MTNTIEYVENRAIEILKKFGFQFHQDKGLTIREKKDYERQGISMDVWIVSVKYGQKNTRTATAFLYINDANGLPVRFQWSPSGVVEFVANEDGTVSTPSGEKYSFD